LNVTTECQDKCVVKMTISLEEEQTNGFLRRAARALSQKYRIPGFRPGKAPYEKVVLALGMDPIHAQVLDQFGDQIYKDGLEQSGLEPVDQAALDQVTWDPLTLHLTMPVGPQVTLGEYRSLRIPWQEPQVTDDDLDQALLRLQKEQTEWKPDQRPAALGDQVVLDIKARVSDEIVLDNTGREMILNADSPYPVPGFAVQVVGMAPGETCEFTLTYPQDHYNADIAGKEAHFEVRLNEIRVAILPLLDDEFAMAVGDYENLDDLKTKLRSSQEDETRRKAEDEYEEQIWEKLLEMASIGYPDVLLNRELDMLKEQLEQQLKQQGLEMASYFQLTNTTEEAWREQIRPQAELRLKRRLILTEVIADQGLQVSTEEIDAEIERVVESLGDRAAEVRESLASPMGRLTIADGLISRKATQTLLAVARGEQASEPVQAEPPAGEEAASVEAGAEVAAIESGEALPQGAEQPTEVAAPAAEPAPSVEATATEEDVPAGAGSAAIDALPATSE